MDEPAPPALSVVVATFNRAAQLQRLLDRLACCEPPPGGFEVIVVDDGSTDRTPEVLGAAVPTVRYLRQENAGPAAARNAGWRVATGSLVSFTDDDCVPDGRWLVDVVHAFEAEPEADAVGGRIVPLVDGAMARFVQAERLVDHGRTGSRVRYLVTANATYRREALETVGGFDTRFPRAAGEDTDLSFRLVAAGCHLSVTDGASVAHDHRTSIRGLFRTYYRHGEACALLGRIHHDRVGASAASMLGPRYWIDRYRGYRQSAGRVKAGVYVVLRAVGLTTYGCGVLASARRLRTSDA